MRDSVCQLMCSLAHQRLWVDDATDHLVQKVQQLITHSHCLTHCHDVIALQTTRLNTQAAKAGQTTQASCKRHHTITVGGKYQAVIAATVASLCNREKKELRHQSLVVRPANMHGQHRKQQQRMHRHRWEIDKGLDAGPYLL